MNAPIFRYGHGTMLKDLTEIEAAEWYDEMFSREPLNGKFNDAQRRQWMERSLACGREYACKIREKYGTGDPKKLAKSMGMSVSYPDFPERTDRVLFAEYREPNMIRIYMDAVKKAERFLAKPEIRRVLTEKLRISDLLLALSCSIMWRRLIRGRSIPRLKRSVSGP